MKEKIIRTVSNFAKGGTVCLATFPNGKKEYAFFLPKDVKAEVGDKVKTETKKGYLAPVKIRAILPPTKKNLNMAGTELCKICG